MFNKYYKSISIRMALVLVLLVGVFGVMPARASALITNATVSEPNFLDADGTLKLDGSTPASFQAKNWDVQLDPKRGPIFSPKEREAFSPLAATTAGNWSALGSNLAGTDGAISHPGPPGIAQEIDVIAVSGTDVYVGGCFQDAGGDPTADYIAKWNGTSWSGIGNDGTATPNGAIKNCIRALVIDGANVYVGGYPNAWTNGAPAAQATYAAKWNGTSWTGLGLALDNQVTSFAIDGNNVYVGGYFSGYIRKWDGVSWSTLGGSGSLNSFVETMKLVNSNLYVGGNFTAVYNGLDLVPEAIYIAKWNGSTWSGVGSNGAAPGGPLNDGVLGLATDGTNLYVNGYFQDINNNGTILTAADYIAKWDGTNWSALGSNGAGDGPLNPGPIAIQVDGSDIYVGGSFTNVNNNGMVLNTADYIVKWDTLTGNWSALGSNGSENGSLNQAVYTLGLLGDKLYVGGRFANVNNNGTVLDTADYIAAYDTCTSGSITVQNTNDSGAGSLRQALADICSGGTINFDSSLAGQMIALISGLPIDKDLILDGSSLTSNIKLDGGSSLQGLVGIIDDTNDVTLKNLDFLNAQYGVYSSSSGTLHVTNCLFSGNDTGIQGGSQSQLTVANSSFSENETGIVNFGVLNVENSIFTNNIRGIYNEKILAVSSLGEATVTGSTFTLNEPASGIHNQNGTLVVTDTDFLNNTSDYGGGIMNIGTATVTNSKFTNNSATQNGGGIHNGGGLTVTASTFYGNSAGNNGGGITGYGGLTISNSSFSGNSAGNFGGGVIFGAPFEMLNTTLDSNSATQGGGVYIDFPSYYGSYTLKNNTISKSSGGNLYINNGDVQLVNDILADSVTGADCFANSAAIVASNNNLIESNSSSPNNCGTPTVTSDPLLGPLANNGGFTQTMALGIGSPAIDAGNDANCPDTDQRGVTRPQGSHCDIGAYEYDGVHFAVIGDYGFAGQPELDVANLVKSWNPDFVITVGDNNYNTGSATTIDQNIGQYYREFIYPYTGSYGAGATINRFFPALGNHDWDTTNAQPYLNYFTLPGNERYYDFVKGPVHFFVIDSDPREPDGISSTSAQATWLKNKLVASTSAWNIVYLHHSPYSSSQHGSTPALQWPFAAWGADAVLSGHDHTYERILRDGIPYFVNGLGGKSIYTLGPKVSGSQLRYNADYGAMLVDASASRVVFKFISRTGLVIDTYTLPITISGNAGVAGATLNYVDGTSKAVTADASGNYSITVPSGWSGTVTPYKSGYQFTPVSKPYSNVQNNQTVQNYIVTVCVSCVDIFLGASPNGPYILNPISTLFQSFPAIVSGPVKAKSTNTDKIFTTQVVTSGGSYNELAGYPVNQFTTEYWFPYYDHGYPNVAGNKMRTWILVGNPSTTQTAEVEIRIGGVLKTNPDTGLTTFSIPPGGNVTPRWFGLIGGPVQVKSTNGVNIFASERVFTVPYNSFNEVMGYPANQFTTEYWFPWYDTVYMDTYLLVGNTSTSQTATVDIYLGTTKYGPYNILPNTTLKQRYANKVTGPVRVVSTNGVNIVTSEFTLSGTENSFNEVMGYPFDQFDTEYWFPYYDHGYPNVSGNKMRTWILVGNPSSSQTATVQIYVDGVLKNDPANPSNYYFSIPPGGNVTPRWLGSIAGPVRVVSDIPIFSSERVFTVPTNAFNEFMGIPFSQFATEYWFTWYDTVYMNTKVLISKP